jgi:hypothetical protein
VEDDDEEEGEGEKAGRRKMRKKKRKTKEVIWEEEGDRRIKDELEATISRIVE